MPGVVIVESLGQGHILLHAAPDKSTRHIADLVSKQFDPYRYFVSQTFGWIAGSDSVPFLCTGRWGAGITSTLVTF